MGTDIYMELQEFKNGAWGDVPGDRYEGYDARSYDDFTVLAGIRSELTESRRGAKVLPISEPRGVPEDDTTSLFAHEAKRDPMDRSYYTVSWLLLEEVDGAPQWGEDSYFCGHVLPSLRAYASETGLKSNELRIVFGFD